MPANFGAGAVYANHDYEPSAHDRDAEVAGRLSECGIALHTTKDQVIFERDEVLSQAGTPFSVFTPYKNAWLKKLTPFHVKAYPVDAYAAALAPPASGIAAEIPSLDAMGFRRTNLAELGVVPGMAGGAALFADFRKRIDDYRETRDFPALKGPSYLSVHLRFGTVSIRELAAYAHARSLHPDGDGAATWLSELIWRDFYAQILWHHPRVVATAFKGEYAGLRFPGSARNFAAWCDGRTGYPIVDAAMRQLNATGYMHNRLRMVAASFLVKDLLVDWRLGREIFRRHADRLRPGVEQRRLAMGGVHRLRCAAVFPDIQSGHAVAEIRCRRQVHPALRARTRAARRPAHPCAVAAAAGESTGVRRGDRPRLSCADRRSCGGAGCGAGVVWKSAQRALTGTARALGLLAPDPPGHRAACRPRTATRDWLDPHALRARVPSQRPP